MPHWERQRWCEQISQINEEKNQTEGADTALEPDPRVDETPVADLEDMI